MISSLNPSAQQFVDNLNKIGTRMERAQQRIATGLKIASVSDDPDSISMLLSARANLASTTQTLTNLGRVKTEVDAAEQGMQNAVSLFENVQTLGAQGASDLQTAATRTDIAGQVDAILQQMVGIAGTSVEGRYLFSGDQDQTIPFTYDATQPNPVSAYQGSTSTRLVQHPNGTTFSVALSGQDIFDSTDPTTNVFTALKTLSAALKANDSTAIKTANDGLAKVDEHLNIQLAFFGTAQYKVNSAIDSGNTLQTQLKAEISGLEEADLTAAILEITQGQTQQQAALQSRASMPRTTLFDFIG
jgi:flagellar hook-associated protein 3 FlgL